MGGLISALEDQHSDGRLDGALTTCGIVAGGLDLNNYQLDGEYAMTQLLGSLMPGGQNIQLVDFPTAAASGVVGGRAAEPRRGAHGGRTHRLRPGRGSHWRWRSSTRRRGHRSHRPRPRRTTTSARRRHSTRRTSASPGSRSSRSSSPAAITIEQAVGGNAGWTLGVNFARELAASPIPDRGRSALPAGRAEPACRPRRADAGREHHRLPVGRVEHAPHIGSHRSPPGARARHAHDRRQPGAGHDGELRTASVVDRAGSRRLSAAGVRGPADPLQLHSRPSSSPACWPCSIGSRPAGWGSVATPQALEASASSLVPRSGLGTPAFVPYEPWPLLGDNGRSTRSPAAPSRSRSAAGRAPDLNRRLPGHNTRDAADFRSESSEPLGRGPASAWPARCWSRSPDLIWPADRSGGGSTRPWRRRAVLRRDRGAVGRVARAREARAARSRRSGIVAATWCLPLLLTAPLFSQDAYSYLAQGTLVHLGHRSVPPCAGGARAASARRHVLGRGRSVLAPHHRALRAALPVDRQRVHAAASLSSACC